MSSKQRYTVIMRTAKGQKRAERRRLVVRSVTAFVVVAGIVAPSPLQELPAHDIVCQSTPFC